MNDIFEAAKRVVFYKKTHSAGRLHFVVRVSDCGHTQWKRAPKAERARKGIAKVEGSNRWKSIHWCSVCGDVWKVRW